MFKFIIAGVTTLPEPNPEISASVNPTWANKPKLSWTSVVFLSINVKSLIFIPFPSRTPANTMSLISKLSTFKLSRVIELKSKSLIKRI